MLSILRKNGSVIYSPQMTEADLLEYSFKLYVQRLNLGTRKHQHLHKCLKATYESETQNIFSWLLLCCFENCHQKTFFLMSNISKVCLHQEVRQSSHKLWSYFCHNVTGQTCFSVAKRSAGKVAGVTDTSLSWRHWQPS